MKLEHKFVDFIPDTISEGILYISIKYNTAVHLCPCGCKREVITPISPFNWELIYNGARVTLYPSIGNWDIPCQSHYWVIDNEIIWSRKWSKSEIYNNRLFDNKSRDLYFENNNTKDDKSLFSRLKNRIN